jgi:Na+-translocating ferredoxin:NAD+ oxidoreductase RnfC subunit
MIDILAQNGVVGCGGAGFPAHAKLAGTIDTIIVNAAECEPLLHKDKELLANYSTEFFLGLHVAMNRVSAKRAIIGIKKKYKELASILAKSCPYSISIHPLPDAYPSGDEFVLAYETLGRIIPPGGLPRDIGAVVQNVETLVNIGREKPVIDKFLTVAGIVNKPATIKVPVGTSFAEAIAFAGGAAIPHFGVLAGGIMMGRLCANLEEPVTKTTGGLIVLPWDHPIITRYARPRESIKRIARAACDQCSFCTELCPRYLLGHPVEPHRVMRSMGIAQQGSFQHARFCCGCRLCSFVSCPEGLDPSEICTMTKNEAFASGPKKPVYPIAQVHPLRYARLMPSRKLVHRLGLAGLVDQAPLMALRVSPRRVQIPLRQHIGIPARPIVRIGQKVGAGDCIGEMAHGELGANIHASINGTITSIGDAIVIEAGKN